MKFKFRFMTSTYIVFPTRGGWCVLQERFSGAGTYSPPEDPGWFISELERCTSSEVAALIALLSEIADPEARDFKEWILVELALRAL